MRLTGLSIDGKILDRSTLTEGELDEALNGELGVAIVEFDNGDGVWISRKRKSEAYTLYVIDRTQKLSTKRIVNRDLSRNEVISILRRSYRHDESWKADFEWKVRSKRAMFLQNTGCLLGGLLYLGSIIYAIVLLFRAWKLQSLSHLLVGVGILVFDIVLQQVLKRLK